MNLADLEAKFVRYETKVEPRTVIVGDQETWRERGCPTEEVIRPCEYIVDADTLADAQGVWFLCPKCFVENGGVVGTHSCQVTFAGRGVTKSQGVQGSPPPRWNVSGSSL